MKQAKSNARREDEKTPVSALRWRGVPERVVFVVVFADVNLRPPKGVTCESSTKSDVA